MRVLRIQIRKPGCGKPGLLYLYFYYSGFSEIVGHFEAGNREQGTGSREQEDQAWRTADIP
jgi:hypothetical protein